MSSLSSSNNKFLLNFLFTFLNRVHLCAAIFIPVKTEEMMIPERTFESSSRLLNISVYMLWIYYNLYDLTMRNVCRKIKRMNKEKGCVGCYGCGGMCEWELVSSMLIWFNIRQMVQDWVCVWVRVRVCRIYCNLWQMKKVLELYANFQKSIVVKWQSHEYENVVSTHGKRSLLEYMGTWKTICVT